MLHGKQHFCLLIAILIQICDGKSAKSNNKLMVLMIDGFKWDYFDLFEEGELPGFEKWKSVGVQAEYLKPAFPTFTFVNLYSAMTGLHPESHGMVHNYMWDEVHQSEFLIGDNRPEQDQAFWWDGGEPFWITAKRQELSSYMWYWNGCEVEIRGLRPDFCDVYQDNPNPSKDDFSAALGEAVAVMTNGSADITAVYYEQIDAWGHDAGPGSDEVIARIRELDQILLDLQVDLDQHDDINVVMFSDHGMSQRVSQNGLVDIMEYIDWQTIDKAYGSKAGPVLQIWPEEGMNELIYDALKEVDHMTIYRKEDIPERYHYKDHYRVSPLLIVADEGYSILRPNLTSSTDEGWHGYDNDLESMRGIFFARGPDFVSKSTVAGFENIEIYNLMCHVTGVTAAPNNGSLDNVCHVLKDGCSSGDIATHLSVNHFMLISLLISVFVCM